MAAPCQGDLLPAAECSVLSAGRCGWGTAATPAAGLAARSPRPLASALACLLPAPLRGFVTPRLPSPSAECLCLPFEGGLWAPCRLHRRLPGWLHVGGGELKAVQVICILDPSWLLLPDVRAGSLPTDLRLATVTVGKHDMALIVIDCPDVEINMPLGLACPTRLLLQHILRCPMQVCHRTKCRMPGVWQTDQAQHFNQPDALWHDCLNTKAHTVAPAGCTCRASVNASAETMIRGFAPTTSSKAHTGVSRGRKVMSGAPCFCIHNMSWCGSHETFGSCAITLEPSNSETG